MDAAAAAWIADRYGLGAGATLSAGPVARGKQGSMWRLRTEAGSYAVKVPFRRVEEAAVGPAARFQETARAAGVPAPAIIRTIDGSVLAEIGSMQVRVYRWVDLQPPDLDLDPVAVGSVVAAMHRVRITDGAAFDPWFSEPVGAARWDALIAELRHARAPFAEQLADVRNELLALEAWMTGPETLQVCHRDLWADNLRSSTAGEQPNTGGVCLIDWEDSGLADPHQELACVLFEFCGGRPERARVLYESYRDSGGPGRICGPGDFTMLIAQLGHIGEAACRDWLVPNRRSPDRSDSAAWFAEFVERPHHRVVLQEILDAVS